MAQTPEGKVKKRVTKILDAAGVYYFFPVTGGYGRSGVADIVCCWRGKFIAIECKAGAGKLTLLQERELKRVREAGGRTFAIWEDGIPTLEAFFNSD